MKVSEIIQPGAKVDIRIVQQVENEKKTDESAKRYISQVLDYSEEGNPELAMPTEGSRLILLPLGIRYELTFYEGGLLYTGIGEIKERYKKDNMYMLEVELKTPLEKFQRREFYRFECSMDVSYYKLTKAQAELETIDEIFMELRDENFREKEKHALMVDLSGGGARFRGDEMLEEGQSILVGMHLANDKINKQYYLVGTVITSYRLDKMKEKKYESRVKFVIKDSRTREEIIRYIFEEERRIRQKVNR